jgi:murein endopeptidase
MRIGLLLAIPAVFALAACGNRSSFEVSSEAKQKMFKAPTDVLPPTTPPSVKDLNDYSVYRIVEAKFGADIHALSVSATIKVQSSAGIEVVDLVGALRPDGTSSLVDLNPLSESENRLVAEAMCVDVGVCKQIILNVYYNVEGKTQKMQFSSDALRAETTPAAAPAPVAAPTAPAKVVVGPEDELHPTERALPAEADATDELLGDFVGAPRNEILIGKLWPRSKTPELPPVLSRADDPQAGVVAPVLPAPSVEKPHATKVSGTPATTRNPRSTPAKPVRAAKPGAPAKTASPAARATPKPTAQTQGFIARWWERARTWLVPPLKTQPPRRPNPAAAKPIAPKPTAAAAAKSATSRPVTPAKPAASKSATPIAVKPAAPVATAPITTAPVTAPSKPTAPAQPPAPSIPDQSKPKTQPQPAPAGPTREEKPATPPVAAPAPAPVAAPERGLDPRLTYPFPPAKPSQSDDELDQRVTLLEAHLAPLVNLQDGGVSRGGYSDSIGGGIRSAIVNASLLPSNIPGLMPVTVNQNAHFGSGMLVSFLENVATYLFKQLNIKLFVGDMSLKKGGRYGGSSSHHTHRNGLDVDLAWIGSSAPLRASALDDRGEVISGFDYEKTWSFLKIASRQELIQDAQKTTAISRVFMSPAIKVGFCEWAKQKDLFQDEAESELMRLVRPVAGHHKHFHLSLKCSPHYPLCRNLAGPPPPGPGCK